MKKRVVASLLWFYSMWYAGAMIAALLGLSPALGPILGTAAAAIIGVDPRRVVWGGARPEPRTTIPAITATTAA